PTIAAVAAQPSATPAPAALRFGLNTTTAEVTPAWIAKDTGIFTKYALDVELATLSADLIVPALISGEIAASHLGSTPLTNSVTSLVQGAVAAAMLGPPATFRAEDEGMRLLLNTADYKLPMMMSGVATTHKWVAANESVARRLIQALAEGVAFAHRERER